MMPTGPEIRTHIHGFLKPKLEEAGLAPEKISDDSDLLALGVLDSFDIVALFADVETSFGIEADASVDDGPDFRLSVDWLCKAFLRSSAAN